MKVHPARVTAALDAAQLYGPQVDIQLGGRERERFWAKVDTSGECWLWTAGDRRGYGSFTTADGRTVYAHRQSYEWEVGLIGDDQEIDHLCRVTLCVRPVHLEAVTSAENIRRANAVNWARPDERERRNVARRATQLGISADEYRALLAAGQKWCTGCKAWHPRSDLQRDASRGDGLNARCRDVMAGRSVRIYETPPRVAGGLLS